MVVSRERPMRTSPIYILAMTMTLLSGCAERPVLELQQTREAVAAALDQEADIYAPTEFDMAQFNLESGEFAVAEQDEAPFWGRNYSQSLEYLGLAFEQAEQAQLIAEANKADVFEQAAATLPEARAVFQSAFEAVEAARTGPVTFGQIQSFDDELAGIFATLNQAEEIYNEGDYAGAFILLQEVQERSAALESSARLIAELAGQ